MSDTNDQADVPEELREGTADGDGGQQLAGAAGEATTARDEPQPGASSEGGDAGGVAEALEGTGGTMPG